MNKLIKWYISIGANLGSNRMSASFHCSDSDINGFVIETDPSCKENIPYPCAELTLDDLNNLDNFISYAHRLARNSSINYCKSRLEHLEKLLSDNNIAMPNVLEKKDE